jgi:FkbM family methyltransferase
MTKKLTLDEMEYFEKSEIRKYLGNKKNGMCVEVGSNEPVSICSQSYHLETELGWKCLLVEPNPILAAKTKEKRPNAMIYEGACVENENIKELELHIPLSESGDTITGHASLEKNADEHNYKKHKSIKVKTDTFSNILKQYNIESVDFISIDVEGAELEVLRGIDFKSINPKLIILEDKHLYLKKHLFLKHNGYKLVRRLNRNCWYIPKNALKPKVAVFETIKLLKRIYLSIWFNKLKYSLRHKTIKPFLSL